MLINPKKAIDEGWITGIKNPEKQLQPNAIDFTLDSLSQIKDGNMFLLSEETKLMRGTKKLEPWNLAEVLKPASQTHLLQKRIDPKKLKNKFFILEKGMSYDGMSDIFIKVPKGVVAKLIVRSTLNRNGMFITSGLYDSGFEGHIGFVLHNQSGTGLIAPGTRVGQIEFYTSDSSELYEGGYNHSEGTHYTEEQKTEVNIIDEKTGELNLQHSNTKDKEESFVPNPNLIYYEIDHTKVDTVETALHLMKFFGIDGYIAHEPVGGQDAELEPIRQYLKVMDFVDKEKIEA